MKITENRQLIIGAGGHAKVVADIVHRMDNTTLIGFLDPQKPQGELISNAPNLGDDKSIDSIIRKYKISHFVIGLGLLAGGNGLREDLFNLGLQAGLQAAVLVHPNAVVSPSAELGAGTVVMAGAIINADTNIGKNVIINTGAVVEHDTKIDDHTHIAPNSTVLGGAVIGRTTLIGANATIAQNTKVGNGTTVGASATVLKDVPNNMVAKGTPAYWA